MYFIQLIKNVRNYIDMFNDRFQLFEIILLSNKYYIRCTYIILYIIVITIDFLFSLRVADYKLSLSYIYKNLLFSYTQYTSRQILVK